MNGMLAIMVLVLMLATVGVLVSGIVVMARGGEVNRKYGNKMMGLRVTLQGAALVAAVLLMVAK